MFCFVVNGQEPRFDKGTRLLLKVFEQSLGANFWDHVCVIYTRWGNYERAVKSRAKKNLTEESRTKEVIEMLNKECPHSKGHMIPIYFTDTEDMEDDMQAPTVE